MTCCNIELGLTESDYISSNEANYGEAVILVVFLFRFKQTAVCTNSECFSLFFVSFKHIQCFSSFACKMDGATSSEGFLVLRAFTST